MTARFFGEYLVQKGAIPPATLVSALVEQMTRLPPTAQIFFEQKLLSPEQIINVFHQQQETGEDFTSACRSLGIWNADLAHKLDEYIKKERIPLGQILVQRGDIDIKTLTKTLDDFLAQAEVHKTAANYPATAAPMVASAPESSYIPDATTDLLLASETQVSSPSIAIETKIDPGMISSIQEMFDERKRRAVKVAMGFIKDKNPPDESVMTKLMQDSLKIIRTIMSLLDESKMESLKLLFKELERAMDARMYASLFPLDEMQKAAEILTEGMDEAWALRDALIRQGTDAHYMKDVAGERYNKVLARLREIQ